MKYIPLTCGKYTIVDDEDFEYLNQFKWYYDKKGYAKKAIRINNKKTSIHLHNLLINTPSGMTIDHINGYGLDNRRINLRLCSRKQNARNSKLGINNTSGYKGVYFNKKRNRWQSSIKVDYKSKHIGVYFTKEAAATAYNNAAIHYFGEFANLNIVY